MQQKLDKYMSYQHKTREQMLVHMGVDDNALEEILLDEEVVLEEIEEALTTYSQNISESKEKTEIVSQMRKSLFSQYYDFNTGKFGP